MSELKAISGHEIREDIDYNTRGIDPENKEWRNYGKELCDTLYYRKSEADAVIAENEDENRRLKHALWLARAERAREAFFKWNLFPNFETVNKLLTIDEYDETPGATDGRVLRTCIEWIKVWNNVERKCRAKAEQYKEEK